MDEMVPFNDAAKFLDRHIQTLEMWQRRGTLVYDFKIGYKRFFWKKTLVEFQNKFANMVSLDDICEKYGISWDKARYYMIQKRDVQLDASIGAVHFPVEVVEMVAKAEGWTDARAIREVSQEDRTDQREAV